MQHALRTHPQGDTTRSRPWLGGSPYKYVPLLAKRGTQIAIEQPKTH
jgi:hypothetical protein